MAVHKLFVVQFSEETRELILSTYEDIDLYGDEILNCINCSNNTLIMTKSSLVNETLKLISNPFNYNFLNPFNLPVSSKYNGFLYNGYALKNVNFCPSGFHFPSISDFQDLIDVIGDGAEFSSGHFKKADLERWTNNELFGSITDYFNLSFLPSGYRNSSPGYFNLYNFECIVYLLGSNPSIYEYFTLNNDNLIITFGDFSSLNTGLSVRLIKDVNDSSESFVDLDGNVYPLVNANGNLWLAENYKCSKLGDGTPILNLTSNEDWINTSSPAYCIYNNDPSLL